MKKVINETYQIDSFKLKIPIDKIVNVGGILNNVAITTQYIEDNGTVLIDKEEKVILTHHTKEKEIPTTYEIRSIYNNSKHIQNRETYCNIKVTSKHLRGRYFEGITNDNIKLVYKSIMDQNIIFVEYEDFIHSTCIDVDFKFDKYINDFQRIVKFIFSLTPDTKDPKKIMEKFNKKHNEGLSFNKREKATTNHPYIKIYNKLLQTQTNHKNGMKDFYDTYLSNGDYDLNNLYRIEYTIQGKQMFEKFGMNRSNKLIDILNTPPQIKEGIVKDIFAIYTEPSIKQIRTSDKLNAIQKKHLIIKDLAIKLGYSTNQLKEYIKGYNFRYDVQKTMLNDIDKINFDDDENYLNEKLKINEEMEKTLQEIGIF